MIKITNFRGDLIETSAKTTSVTRTALMFSKLQYMFFGYFDPKMMLFEDVNIGYSGWRNRYYGRKIITGYRAVVNSASNQFNKALATRGVIIEAFVAETSVKSRRNYLFCITRKNIFSVKSKIKKRDDYIKKTRYFDKTTSVLQTTTCLQAWLACPYLCNLVIFLEQCKSLCSEFIETYSVGKQ